MPAFCAIGFRGKPFLPYRPLQGLSLDCHRPLLRKRSVVVAAIVQESPRQSKPNKGRFARRFANLGCFCEFGMVFLKKTRRIHKTPPQIRELGVFFGKIEWGVSGRGGFSNSRCVLKPDVAIASEVSILSKNSLAITDFHAKKTQHVQLFENPLPGTPPFAIPKFL